MASQSKPRERLDVESSEERQSRLSNLLSNISSPTTESPEKPLPQSQTIQLPSRPEAVPESDALARARAFLPLFKASNNELLEKAAKDPNSVNMEKINGNQAIAMDLGLGVFDAPKEPRSNLGPEVDSQPPTDIAVDDEDDEDDPEDSDDTSSLSSSEVDSTDEDTTNDTSPTVKSS
ncbi:uncharacterized protein I206_104074 [Kwoniella pini CBS 10737]|uniref:Uncharacterized protein n=1 Tax=Kwoniella pini CBS 10737 TaxID=1296096 RepID=A0A1B9I2Q9_9TREE|nr:uncharacterized protein I206_04350 [Kwoniella pini CBS 10737]OCF49823.1 hypothetical protein I206_04350 [Kwoniella pini CBS 10737]